MNYALSQRRTDRHPVGLMIVVGMHVLLAAVLVSAKIAANKPRTDVASVVLTPEPPKPIEKPKIDLPKPPQVALRQQIIVPPILPPDQPPPPDTVTVPTEPIRPPPDIVVARVDTGPARDGPARVTALARAARFDAGASECRPEYPAAAQRAGAVGTTRIRFTVDATGRVAGSQILQASGTTRENRMMDKAAADALARCPVQVGTDELGRPTGTTTDVTYVWSLN